MKNVNPEGNMAIQNTISQGPKSPLAALFGLVPLLLCGDPLGEAAASLSHLVCALTGELLKFAPSIILAAAHALEGCFFAHQQLFLCVQTLLSSWQLLHCILGTA
jgi:hypothetical protein